MNIEMQENRVLLRRISLQERTKGGLILRDITSREDDASAYGQVEAVGKGKHYDYGFVPTEYQVGDVLCFNPRAIIKVFYRGKYYGIMRETDVFFRVPKDELEQLEITTFDESEGKEYDYKRSSIIN